MACTKPLHAYRSRSGGITFKIKEGYYDQPIELECRQCIACRLKKSREWALRCTHEAQMHERNCFLTLTYNDESLPKNLSINVEHWKLFAKRLRKKLGPVRYFHCGEYGEQNKRPHYHALLFGIDFSADRVPLDANAPGKILYTSKTLESLWPYGFSTIGNVDFQSASYVARYCLKKITGDQADAHYSRVDPSTGETWTVKPEYITMSLKPGLGESWFKKYKSDVYPDDFCLANGKKMRPPRYYDQLLEKSDPKLLEQLIDRRRKHALSLKKDQTPERLEVINNVLKAKLALKPRKL